jgi:TonB family protein
MIGVIIYAVCICFSLQAHTPGPKQNAPERLSCQKCYEDGHAHLSRGDYQQAIESFTRSVQADPDKDRPAYYLGLSYYRLGHYREALAAYQKASELAPSDPFTHYELGKTYHALGNKEAAENKHQLLKNLAPELAEYLFELFSRPLPTAQPAKESNQPAQPTLELEKRGDETVYPAGKLGASSPSILYKERARYTEIARRNKVQGTVLLSAIFSADGQIKETKVLRWLPDGLALKAMEAAQKIRFKPATKDGAPITVRASVEFNFALY